MRENPGAEAQLEATSRLIADHPDFFGDTAIEAWRDAVTAMLPDGIAPKRAERVAAEAAALAVAMSDGIFSPITSNPIRQTLSGCTAVFFRPSPLCYPICWRTNEYPNCHHHRRERGGSDWNAPGRF